MPNSNPTIKYLHAETWLAFFLSRRGNQLLAVCGTAEDLSAARSAAAADTIGETPPPALKTFLQECVLQACRKLTSGFDHS